MATAPEKTLVLPTLPEDVIFATTEAARAAARQFFDTGVCVVDTSPLFKDRGAEFDAMLDSLVCFSGAPTALGAFAAFNTPCSLHNVHVRKWRAMIHAAVFEPMARATGLHVRQFFDRVLSRPAGVSVPGESAHQDIVAADVRAQFAQDAEVHTFGGWINMGATMNRFECWRGTHTVTHDKESLTAFNKNAHGPVTKIPIPPGHMVIFDPALVHRFATYKGVAVQRLFVGGLFTDASIRALTWTPAAVFDDQALPRLKDGGVIPGWAKCHWTNHPFKIDAWTIKNLKEKCTTSKTLKTGARKGQIIRVPVTISTAKGVETRVMKSLRALDLPLYPGYTPEERAMYF